MKIILDAMGGDNAPDAVVRGALEAAKEFGVQIVLVGRGADILASMKAQGWDTLPDGVELANADASLVVIPGLCIGLRHVGYQGLLFL